MREFHALVAMFALGCASAAPAGEATPSSTQPTSHAVASPQSEAPSPAQSEAQGTPAPPANPGPPPPNEDMREILEAHNRYRAQHCAPSLTWSPELARTAQRWADGLRRGCSLRHSGGSLGENLAAGTAGTLNGTAVADMWYSELRRYSFRRPGFSMQSGHFSQLVWVGTQRLGCGTTECNGMTVWVCNYDPPGNVEGDYPANVLPTSCRR